MQELPKIFRNTLWAAHDVHNQLGKAGEETVQTNQFGDTAVVADIKCEEAVLGALQEHTVPIKVISEEHGITTIGDTPQYLGILDGIDGSSLYKKARGIGRYGTMFAIFDGLNPTYNDYLVCGIMQHATGRLFMAQKHQGASIVTRGGVQRTVTSGKQDIDTAMQVYIDEYFEYNRTTFSPHFAEFSPKYEAASSLYYAALAEGAADLVLECTRKGNLEIAVQYGLTREAGGAVIDLDGNDIGSQHYLTFGQQGYQGIISAASSQLAVKALQRV